MKKFIAGLAVVGSVVIGVGLHAVPPASKAATPKGALAHYSVIVTRTGEGFKMTCTANCGWKELSYSCEGEEPCSAVVDEAGVRGAQKKDLTK